MESLKRAIDGVRAALTTLGAQRIIDGLQAGLSEAALSEMTKGLDVPPKGLVRELYKIVDGQSQWEHHGALFPNDIVLLSLESAASHRTDELARYVSARVFDAQPESAASWWPIATFEDFTLVVSLDTERVFWLFESETYFASDNLVRFFEHYRDVLAAGGYEVETRDGDEPYTKLKSRDDTWVYETLSVR
ncbi:MAG: hypothetical protein ABIY55_20760 [Kofleriaceae bacterium]